MRRMKDYAIYAAQVFVGTPAGLDKCAVLRDRRAYHVHVLACDEFNQMPRMAIHRLRALTSFENCNFTFICGDMKQMVQILSVRQAELVQYSEIGLQGVLTSSHSRKVLLRNGTVSWRALRPADSFQISVNHLSAPEIVALASAAAYRGMMKASRFWQEKCSAENFVFGNVAYVDCVNDASCVKTAYGREDGRQYHAEYSSDFVKKNEALSNSEQVRRAVDYVEIIAITCSTDFYNLSPSGNVAAWKEETSCENFGRSHRWC